MTHPWWKTGVVYQVYPRSFQDANRDGVGDLAGILSRVGYLAHTLGIDAVWLSPFYRSPMADFGYDVADYTDVDPIFGTLEDFDELRAAIHAHGLKLIVDFVPNHSSDQHPWFMESRLSKESPKRDWYVWRDPAPDGGPPNNWLSVFGGSAWTFDEPTGQYYLHSFLEEQPDLNWRNPDVEAAMHDALRFWLDRGVDGFRLDVAHFIMKDPELRDNPLASDAGEYHKDMGDYDTQEHIHDKGHPDVHAAFARIRQVLDEYPDRYSVGEIHEFDWEQWASYYGNGKGLHMPFNFGLLKAKWEAGSVREIVDAVEAAVPDNGWPNYVLGNHDEKRIATRLGEPQSRAAAVLLLTLRGTPTLYYGDELGMREASIPDALQQDPWGQRVPGLGRDGCRTPMQWDASSNAGFTEAAMPWLPVQSGYPHRNVAAELEDPVSTLNLYRALLALRKRHPGVQHGAYTEHETGNDQVLVYERSSEGDRVLVAINFSAAEQTVEWLDAGWEAVLSSVSVNAPNPRNPGTLLPYEAVIYTQAGT